jgi:hypothetical protein
LGRFYPGWRKNTGRSGTLGKQEHLENRNTRKTRTLRMRCSVEGFNVLGNSRTSGFQSLHSESESQGIGFCTSPSIAPFIVQAGSSIVKLGQLKYMPLVTPVDSGTLAAPYIRHSSPLRLPAGLRHSTLHGTAHPCVSAQSFGSFKSSGS